MAAGIVAHLEALRQDVRDEVKRRIEQRDRYSIQLTIALGVIVGVAFSDGGFRGVLLAGPLVSIYLTVLIQYSYRIHRILAQYLREVLEPQLSDAYGTSLDIEWETWYAKHAIPGIRRVFFLLTLWVVCISFPAYLGATEETLRAVAIGSGTIYVLTAVVVTALFWRR